MNSFISTIENILGVECSPELVVAARKAHKETFFRISEVYNDVFDESPYDLQVSKGYGDLVPYLPACPSAQFFRMNGYMGMLPEDLDTMATVSRAIERLKPMLLYSHAVAIDDPGAFVLGSFYDCDEANFQHNRQIFMNYLEFMVTIKPLLQTGAIILLPGKVTRMSSPLWYEESDKPMVCDSSGMNVADARMLYIQEKEDLSGEMELLEFFPQIESYVWAMTKVSAAHFGAFDYYLPQVSWLDILNVMLKAAGKIIYGPHRQEPDVFSARPLVDIHIPNLEGLPYSDVIRLRTSEPAFECWRTSLREALSTVKAVESESEGVENFFFDDPRAEVFEASVRLEEAISHSIVMGKAVRGIKQFTVGSITGSVADTRTWQCISSLPRTKLCAFSELLVERKKQAPEDLVLNFYVSIT